MNSGSSKRVLIIEDSHDIQHLLTSLLQSDGYTVDCASNGVEALNFLNTQQDLPGLILLDLMMPQMDGYQFREEQAKHSRFSDIPVVVMTADGDIKNKTIRARAQAFLKKPFANIETILETVDQFYKAS